MARGGLGRSGGTGLQAPGSTPWAGSYPERQSRDALSACGGSWGDTPPRDSSRASSEGLRTPEELHAHTSLSFPDLGQAGFLYEALRWTVRVESQVPKARVLQVLATAEDRRPWLAVFRNSQELQRTVQVNSPVEE